MYFWLLCGVFNKSLLRKNYLNSKGFFVLFFFSFLHIVIFLLFWQAVDCRGSRNDWKGPLLNSRSVCFVMAEDSIRGKLGNSRIGVAITADIRPLNHGPVKPYSRPIRPDCPCLATSSISLSSFALTLVLKTLSDRKKTQSVDLFSADSWLSCWYIKPQSPGTKTHREDDTLSTHWLDTGLLLLILQGGRLHRSSGQSSLCECPAVGWCVSDALNPWHIDRWIYR